MSDCRRLDEPLEMSAPGICVIRAKTQRQAMDWALVLASQGIEAVIQREPAGQWELQVPGEVGERSLAIIRQYRIENRHWHWRPRVFKQRMVFDWTACLWVLLLLLFYWLSSRRPELRLAGVLNGEAVRAGEWWRLITATWLHADLAHLMSNAGFGLLLVALALGRHGTGVGLLATLAAGALGNVASLWVHGEMHRGLGASGMVMGALGLLAAQPPGRSTPGANRNRVLVTAMAAIFLLFVLLGMSPQSDVAAHAGGFLAGLVLGWLLVRVPDLATNIPLNLTAGMGFALVVLLTWIRAVSKTAS